MLPSPPPNPAPFSPATDLQGAGVAFGAATHQGHGCVSPGTTIVQDTTVAQPLAHGRSRPGQGAPRIGIQAHRNPVGSKQGNLPPNPTARLSQAKRRAPLALAKRRRARIRRVRRRTVVVCFAFACTCARPSGCYPRILPVEIHSVQRTVGEAKVVKVEMWRLVCFISAFLSGTPRSLRVPSPQTPILPQAPACRKAVASSRPPGFASASNHGFFVPCSQVAMTFLCPWAA